MMMKKIFALIFCMLLTTLALVAQDAEMMAKAFERYQNMTTLTAEVTQTRHNVMLTSDVVSQGHFYYKKPASMVLVFNDGKDMLLMKDESFTMKQDGKARTVKGGGNEQFEALKTMMTSFSTGQASDIALEDLADVDAEVDGALMSITITPRITDAKARRKMLFTSFVVVVDTQAGQLKSIRLNEKGSNYTQYDFGKFVVDAPVDDAVFQP